MQSPTRRSFVSALFIGAITLVGYPMLGPPSAQAQGDYRYDRDDRYDRHDRRDSYRNRHRRFHWRQRPRWVYVPGTRVMVVREGYRPDFDVFRYGSFYFVLQDGRWYRSRDYQTGFVIIREDELPMSIRRVPRNHWHRYPDRWDGHEYRHSRY